jgi:hypothetical protein
MDVKNYNKEILSHVISIKEDVAGIKEHLKQLNSKVATHETQIYEHKCKDDICHNELEHKINNINITLAKWGGAVVVLVAVVNIVIAKFF